MGPRLRGDDEEAATRFHVIRIFPGVTKITAKSVTRGASAPPRAGTSPERHARMLASAEHLAHHLHEAPVWIVPCLAGATPTRTSGASVYPAVQNMLLAVRALGLGATLTTLYLQFEKDAEAAMGLPPGVHSYAILPIGYPLGRFGPVRRGALADVVYEDRWGQAYGGA